MTLTIITITIYIIIIIFTVVMVIIFYAHDQSIYVLYVSSKPSCVEHELSIPPVTRSKIRYLVNVQINDKLKRASI